MHRLLLTQATWEAVAPQDQRVLPLARHSLCSESLASADGKPW